MSVEDVLVEQVVRGWRDKLVNLTSRNRLLNFRDSKRSTLQIIEPDLDGALKRVMAGSSLKVISLESDVTTDNDAGEFAELLELTDPEAEDRLALVRSDPTYLGANVSDKDVRASLRALFDYQTSMFLDTGLSVTYLAVGVLEWSDPESPGKTLRSPLVLVPVELESTSRRSATKLVSREDEVISNRALELKLASMDIALPDLTETTPEGIARYVKEVSAFAASRPGWSVRESCILSYFTFHKEAMYQDLADHLSIVTDSPLVRALATAGTEHAPDGFLFDPAPQDDIDILDVPENSLQVLDADSSQRAAILAAREGKSFVLEGPPGTGKSQTIANIIATQIAEGRRVLFVSEKIAALEVVKNRLDQVGLGNYLLELHSSKAKRSVVASALGNSLHKHPQASSFFSDTEREGLRRRREALTDYVERMNDRDTPIGLSLHDAIGEVAKRAHLPEVPFASYPLEDLDSAAVSIVMDAARRLQRAWRPAIEGLDFPWHGVSNQAHPRLALTTATVALQDLREVMEPYEDIVTALGWEGPDAAHQTLNLLDAAASWSSDNDLGLLTRNDWDRVTARSDALLRLASDLDVAESALASSAGPAWARLLDHETGAGAEQVLQELSNFDPKLNLKPSMTASDVGTLLAQLGHYQDALERLTCKSAELAHALGLITPETLDEVQDVLDVFTRATGRHRPEAAWFKTDIDGDVERGIRALRSAQVVQAEARSNAITYFRPSILESNPVELNIRFSNQHGGISKFVSSAYRTDKKTLQGACQAGVDVKDAISKLKLAAAWQESEEKLAEEEAKHAAILGSRYRGADTDWEGLEAALANARAIAAKARASALEKLAQAAAHGTDVDPATRSLAEQVQASLTQTKTAIDSLTASLATPTLHTQTLTAQKAWAESSLVLVDQLHVVLASLDNTLERTVTVSAASAIQQNLRNVTFSRDALNHDRESILTTFPGLSNLDLDTARHLAAQVASASTIRKAARGDANQPIPDDIAAAILDAGTPESLKAALVDWESARDAVLTHFNDDSRERRLEWFTAWDTAEDLLHRLTTDDSGPVEWHSYTQARTELAQWGMDQPIQALIALRASANIIPDVIKRELLRPWVEDELTDPVFEAAWSADRDSLVADFASADRQLVASAVADIITLANSRRPTANLGPSKLIDSEAQKKSRHLPIRDLLSRTATVAQVLKPVFMMSPLAVSQFLTSAMRFDLVIFDEASQVLPEDAINCIYRADQLIIAGDDKQLPPTSFFELDDPVAQDDIVDEYSSAQDFESILKIAKGSGAFSTITLKWHYRSRHESLITFSNQRFYDGELITFPSTITEGPNVGVEFFKVPDGSYARGGARNNFPEARFVAERIAHHYDTRPGMSLGVVALSQAQAEAIESAVDELIQRRPSLERLIDTTRLNGLFVKNLESVQGDERDVMIMSIGYGPDEHGKFTMNFGPMNRDGGWRRLNVAVTRARYRNEIVASFDPSQMTETTQKSVAALRAYLDYAQRGVAALALDSTHSLGDAESPFEESVLAWLVSEGFSVVTQVGASGYRIDMAVQRPGRPGQFVLGIECDGVAYHGSRAARDRDRLREEVLNQLGWRLHRIWGTSWYRNREQEQNRLRAAIEAAIDIQQDGILPRPVPKATTTAPTVEEVDIDIDSIAPWVTEYEVATPAKPPRTVRPDAPDAVPHLAKTIKAVIESESPIHRTVLLQRVKVTWSIAKLTPDVQRNLDKALDRHAELANGDFYMTQDLGELFPTRRHNSETKREAGHIHVREIEDTAWQITRDAVEISHDDLVITTARYLGFQRLRAEARGFIEAAIDGLIAQGFLQGDRSRLHWSEEATPPGDLA